MQIHEFQAKDLFSEYEIPVPPGRLADSPEQAVVAAEKMGPPVVIKAQIHAGGRGKAGGVRVVKTLKDARHAATEIIGHALVTPQTGPEGRVVHKVLVEKPAEIARELYVSIVLNRHARKPAFLVSPEGGMDIEKLAHEKPHALLTEIIHPLWGPRQYQLRAMVSFLDVSGHTAKKLLTVLQSLWRLYREKDASLVEINPLVITKGGDVMALDGKINFDDNALYRHPNIQAMRDLGEENPYDVEASKHKLNYIKLDGTIGCMVNGAGLAMATMDIIKFYGGEPANFLDVGGGANAEQIESAFRLLLSDSNTKGILINIFGGILRCDVLAHGLVEGAAKAEVKVPMVIRMEGTNVEEGRKILDKCPLPFVVADSMDEAAQKIIHLISKPASGGHAARKAMAEASAS
jgi:succinyl-CoA synthetase beta subunit